jgi:hypothetical protein
MSKPTSLLWILVVGCSAVSSDGETARSPSQADACTATVVTPPQDLPDLGARRAIVFRPGDSACLVATPAGEWRPLARADALTPHIEARMTADGATTSFRFRNATSAQLTYRVALQVKLYATWRETSGSSVRAGRASLATWQEPIEAVAVFDIHSE